MRKHSCNAWAVAGAAAAVLTVPRWAAAATACPSTLTNEVVVAGSTAIQPVLQALAQVLGPQSSILYVNNGSCSGLTAMTATPATTITVKSDGSQYGVLFNTDGSVFTFADGTQSCDPTALYADAGFSDVYAGTCQANGALVTLPSAFQADFLGPIQAMGFWVPAGSQATSISAEAAYVVYGWTGKTYTVPPWTSTADIFYRSASSGTQGMIAKAIGLASVKWGAQGGTGSEGSTVALLDALTSGTANVMAAIGIAAAEDPADNNIAGVQMLAYQHTGQSCGYYPSSNANTSDMINVRQGRYAIWGPEHVIVNVDANGNPVDHTHQPNPGLTALMNLFIETGPSPSTASTTDAGVTDTAKEAVIAAEATAGVVPWCAMQVTRTSEIGPESSYQPPEPCGCFYESALGATTTVCVTCQSATDCTDPTTPVCRHGFCEAQ